MSNVVDGMNVEDATPFDMAEFAAQSVQTVDTIPPAIPADSVEFPNEDISADDSPVTPVVDAPDLTVAPATGAEDGAIALDLSAALIDPAPGESLALTLAGLPEGATLSAGTDNGDGSWTLAPEDLAGLTLTPPPDVHGDLALSVTAVASLGSDSRSVTAPLAVTVTPVVDAPDLTVAPATGAEDGAIALDLSAALIDPAPGESLALTLAGLPEGATLSAGTDNGDGSWTLAPEDLAGLTLTPPPDVHGDLALSVTAVASLGPDSRSVTAPLAVTVTPVVDAPDLTVAPATGAEDGAIALDLSAALIDPAPGESLALTLAGLPEGATLSAGTDNGDGSWTLAPEDLAGLTLTPPPDVHGDLALSVTAVASLGPDSRSVTAPLAVTVTPVVDAPDLTVAPATGAEDGAIALDLSAALIDPAPGESLALTLAGLPEGATLSAGTDNGDGSWTLAPEDLAGLTLTPPPDVHGDLALSVTAVASLGPDSRSVTAPLAVTVTPVVDAPDLTVAPATGAEDGAIALDLSAALIDPAPGESLALTLAGLPEGATLSAGTDNGDGSWTLAPEDLAGLTLTPPPDVHGDLALSVTAVASLGPDSRSVTAPLAVTVTPVVDAPDLTVAPATGAEDGAIALDLSAALIDPAPGESLALTLAGLPEGATLSAGTDNGDGSWTLAPEDLAGLTLTPPPDVHGDLALSVTAVASLGPDSRSVTAPLAVTVTPVVDAPDLTVAPATGAEDGAIALDLSAALIDPAPGESLALTLAGLPEGATLSAGTDNGDGSWTLAPEDLAGLTLTPPPDVHGDLALSVTAVASLGPDSRSVTAPLAVTVTPVVDAPDLTVAPATGAEDGAIALDLSAALIDPAPGESLALTLAGLPEGATLSAGTDNGDGSWTLAPEDLAGLTLTPPPDVHGDLALSVTAVASLGPDSRSVTAPLAVTVTPVVDAPDLTVAPATGAEDGAIALDLSAALIDPAPGESLALTLAGLPEGATLSAGTDNGDGSWTLAPEDLAGLTLTPPPDVHGDLALSVTAVASLGPDSRSVTAPLAVTVTPVVDAPDLTVAPATGAEDGAIALDLSAALIDPAPGESLALTLAGLPEGATLSAG
ncbi:hypothetical protein [Rhodovulum sp. MB263]|uniref:hypothetical protein n=1 Tax=Rhodovulum sp. (strain MB263) TaxID=308754 RepID=UPI0009B73664|nr:hypothetical protein [Rhodovulum sp. MB263]ARC87673.1 hypothetical protein B5V46_03065 [Rhodovulum sp. MB263]